MLQVKEKTLVLVISGLAGRPLGIVSHVVNDMGCEVTLIAPKELRETKHIVDLGDLMPIAENIYPTDIGEQITPVLHRLAETQFQHELFFGTVRLATNKVSKSLERAKF